MSSSDPEKYPISFCQFGDSDTDLKNCVSDIVSKCSNSNNPDDCDVKKHGGDLGKAGCTGNGHEGDNTVCCRNGNTVTTATTNICGTPPSDTPTTGGEPDLPRPGPLPPLDLHGWPSFCEYRILHFNDEFIASGDYITNQFKNYYGVESIQARPDSGGHTPGGAARIFNTDTPNGDTDLGTPNSSCDGGGPGTGAGGEKGGSYENCDRLGLSLIIQKTDDDEPSDLESGGWVDFHFDALVHVDRLVILDSKGSEPVKIKVGLILYKVLRLHVTSQSIFSYHFTPRHFLPILCSSHL